VHSLERQQRRRRHDEEEQHLFERQATGQRHPSSCVLSNDQWPALIA
jgi:hypothetical protein